MSSDGKKLEGLVAFVEKLLLPSGFDVTTNERVYNDEGVQIAEFDIEIRGRVGSTTISWLIECRDRPGSGPAPGGWIEQLVGRRARFGFNKVTAVSTTGFAVGAAEFAKSAGIELREVKEISADDFRDWLAVQYIRQVSRVSELRHASILVSPNENEARKSALMARLSRVPTSAAFLKALKTGSIVSLSDAFSAAASEAETLFDDVVPGGPGKAVHLHVDYVNDEDHFVIETPEGEVRVWSIEFVGELRTTERLLPLSFAAEYRHAETGEAISQVAVFSQHAVQGLNLVVEMHRVSESGVTHLTLRRIP